jgi:hypothetical protein
MRRILVLLVLAGCDDLQGASGEATPLVTLRYEVTGDFESVRVPDAASEQLRVAIVWGAQWLAEPLCFLPAESAEAEADRGGLSRLFGFVLIASTRTC